MTQLIELGNSKTVQPIAIEFRLTDNEDVPSSKVFILPAENFNIPVDETTKVHLNRVAGEKEKFAIPTVGFMARMIVSAVAMEGRLIMATLIPEFHNPSIKPAGIEILAAQFYIESGIGLSLVLPGESYVITVDFSESPIFQPEDTGSEAQLPDPLADPEKEPQT